MNNQIKTAFLAMIVLQAAHSVEEFIFKLYELSPLMKVVYQQAPSLAKPAFIVFNLLLISFGLSCFFYWVRPARETARGVVWVWVGIQLATIAAHALWALSVSGYHPGLATAPLFVPVVAYVVYLLRRVPSTGPRKVRGNGVA